jgi:hypothetical protein
MLSQVVASAGTLSDKLFDVDDELFNNKLKNIKSATRKVE